MCAQHRRNADMAASDPRRCGTASASGEISPELCTAIGSERLTRTVTSGLDSRLSSASSEARHLGTAPPVPTSSPLQPQDQRLVVDELRAHVPLKFNNENAVIDRPAQARALTPFTHTMPILGTSARAGARLKLHRLKTHLNPDRVISSTWRGSGVDICTKVVI